MEGGINGDPDYREKMSGPMAPEWQKAMDDEISALEKMKTFAVVKRPPGAHVIDSRWVLTEKRVPANTPQLLKGRVVAKGFSQVPGVEYDETYAPTASKSTLRLLFALEL